MRGACLGDGVGAHRPIHVDRKDNGVDAHRQRPAEEEADFLTLRPRSARERPAMPSREVR